MNARVDFEEACFAITRAKGQPAVNYAVAYAEHAIRMLHRGDSVDDLIVQTLYILNNVTRWRGDTATKTRTTLKRLSKAAAWQ